MKPTTTLRLDIDAVRNVYRRYAGIYDLYFGPLMQQGRKTAIRKMNCRPGDHVLEVGVGTGLSLSLYPQSVQITGIDISAEMLKRAHARKERHGLNNVVALREMDAERMQFDDNSFDRVAAIYVASVVPNPTHLVNEMRRVCKPEGELFFLNHFHSTHPVVAGMERLLSPLSRVLGFHPDLALDSFVVETDLDVMEKIPTNLFGYWTLLRVRNNKNAVERALDALETLQEEVEVDIPMLAGNKSAKIEHTSPTTH